ncbi:hypothetical protein N499_1325A, partial [Wolbachia pipientis wVitA]
MCFNIKRLLLYL